MSREERRIYQIGVAVAAVLLLAMVSVITEDCTKSAVFAAQEYAPAQFAEESSESPEKGQIRETEAEREPETEEETENEAARRTASEADRDHALGTDTRGKGGNFRSSTADAGSHEADAGAAPGPVYYRIAGDLIPEEIQAALFEALTVEGVADWYEGALATIYQESHGNPWAENPNGLDKGLLQYRITYWPETAAANGEPGADIFDWRAQVRVYARQAARRINAGLTAEEVISRHKTSDHCPGLDRAYINQVTQWLGRMEAAQ